MVATGGSASNVTSFEVGQAFAGDGADACRGSVNSSACVTSNGGEGGPSIAGLGGDAGLTVGGSAFHWRCTRCRFWR